MCKVKLKFNQILFLCLMVLACATALGCIKEKQFTSADVSKTIQEQYPFVLQMSTQQLSYLLSMEGSKSPILLDVRERHEYVISHLKNALHATTIEEAVEILNNSEKEQLIVIYCSIGFRSCNIAKQLNAYGFKRVYNLEGGIFKWANEGKPVYSNEQQARHVHPFNANWGQLLKKSLWSPAPIASE